MRGGGAENGGDAVTSRLDRAVAELKDAMGAARQGDAYDAARQIDCAAASFFANQPADTTISHWTARNRAAGRRWACIFCTLLTIDANLVNWRRATRDHCAKSLASKEQPRSASSPHCYCSPRP
jgi:hypothetical protein